MIEFTITWALLATSLWYGLRLIRGETEERCCCADKIEHRGDAQYPG